MRRPAAIVLALMMVAILSGLRRPALGGTARGPDWAMGSVSGQALDEAGLVISGATVVLRCRGGLTVARTTHTDEQGRFRLTGVSAGVCSASAIADGYRDTALPDFELGAGDHRELTVRLTPDPWSRPRKATGESGLEIGLPLPYRRVEALIQLTGALDGDRGAGGGVRGGRHFGAAFAVDGFDITDPFAPGLGHTLPYVTVVGLAVTPAATGPLATFASGVNTELLTRSGSNKVEADVRVSWMPSAQGASHAGGTEMAAQLSGPVVKDCIWYELAGELVVWPRPADPRSALRLSPVGLAKLATQVNSRNKLTLLGLSDANSGAINHEVPPSAGADLGIAAR